MDSFMVRLGAEAEFNGAATNREPDSRRGFHRDDHPGTRAWNSKRGGGSNRSTGAVASLMPSHQLF